MICVRHRINSRLFRLWLDVIFISNTDLISFAVVPQIHIDVLGGPTKDLPSSKPRWWSRVFVLTRDMGGIRPANSKLNMAVGERRKSVVWPPKQCRHSLKKFSWLQVMNANENSKQLAIYIVMRHYRGGVCLATFTSLLVRLIAPYRR